MKRLITAQKAAQIAEKIGWYKPNSHPSDDYIVTQEEMVMFAEAIRKEALEECIGICDEVARQYGQYTFTARIVAETIKEILE